MAFRWPLRYSFQNVRYSFQKISDSRSDRPDLLYEEIIEPFIVWFPKPPRIASGRGLWGKERGDGGDGLGMVQNNHNQWKTKTKNELQ